LFFAVLPTTPSVHAADAIPLNLVGVWATDKAVLRGPYLMEGQALYLGSDGVGAFVGGPPPIAFKIIATFDPTTNNIDFDIYEGKQRHSHGSLAYDPAKETIDTGAPKHLLMTRRSSSFTDETKKGLGL